MLERMFKGPLDGNAGAPGDAMSDRSVHVKTPARVGSRPRALAASVATVPSTFGELTAALGRTRSGVPHEVFLRGTAPGSDASTVVEAIARLASLALQLPSSVTPAARLDWVIEALSTVPGPRSSGAANPGSLPAAVAAALASAAAASVHPRTTAE